MYKVLHNSSVNISERVKVARYSWKESTVQWPHKEEEIIHWIGTTLSEKTWTETEYLKLWRCLHDILQTSKCHSPTAHGQPLLPKPLIFQLLLKELDRHAQGDPVTCSERDIIVSCCHTVLTSPAFGHVWKTRLDYMFQLFIGCTQLCTQLLKKDQQSSQLLQLLELSSQMYLAAYNKNTNQQQVVGLVSQKLFHLVVAFQQAVGLYRGSLLDQLQAILSCVLRTVFVGLFPWDLYDKYETYLQIKTDSTNSTKSSPPKYIEALFSQITCCLKHESTQRGIIDVLPKLYLAFINVYKGSHRLLCFQLFQYLLHLLQIVPADEIVTMTIQHELEIDLKLSVLESLLDVMAKEEIYDIHANCQTQLSWLRSLRLWLNSVELGAKSSSWFNSQRHLLALNYQIVKPNMKIFLLQSWLEVGKLEPEADISQSQLLSDVVRIYAQLHQLPKFVLRLLPLLRETNLVESVSWSQVLENSLMESIMAETPSGVLNIWEILMENMFLEGFSSYSIEAACHLFSIVLVNGRLVDYNITHQVAVKVETMMQVTWKEMLLPALKNIKQETLPVHAAAVLQLVHSWGQLHLALQQFGRHYGGAGLDEMMQPLTASLHCDNLMPVHPYFSKWKLLGKLVRSSGDYKSLYIWIKLLLQKMRPLLCQGSYEERTLSVCNVISDVLTHLPDGSTRPAVHWDKQLRSVTKENFHIAVWSELLQVLPLVAALLSKEELARIADHFVNTMIEGDEHPTNILQEKHRSHLTEQGASRKLIDHGALWELSHLLTAVLRSVWLQIGKLTGPVKHRSRKKVKVNDNGDKTIAQLTERIIEQDFSDTNELKAICKDVGKLLKSPRQTLLWVSVQVKHAHSLLKVLLELPVEEMLLSNQTQCFLATLLLLSAFPVVEETYELVNTGLNLLYVLYLRNRNRQHLCHLSVKAVLCWLVTYLRDPELPPVVTDKGLQLYKAMLRQTKMSTDLFAQLPRAVRKTLKLFKEDPSNVWTMQTMVCLFQRTKMGASDICDILDPWLANLIRTHLNSDIDPPGGTAVQVLALEAYGVRLKRRAHSSMDETVTRQLGNICDLCLMLMKQQQSCQDLQGCLRFVLAVCAYKRIHNTNSIDLKNSKDKRDPGITSVDLSENKSDSPVASSEEVQKSCVDDQILTSFLSACWDILINKMCEISARTHIGQGHVMHHLGGGLSQMGFNKIACNEKSSEESLRDDIKEGLGHLVAVSGTEQFTCWLHQLLNVMETDSVEDHSVKLQIILEVWGALLLSQELSVGLHSQLIMASQTLIIEIQELISTVTHCWSTQWCPLVVAALTTETILLSCCQDRVEPQLLSSILDGCLRLPLLDMVHEDFMAIFPVQISVLNQFLIDHTDTIIGRIAPFSMLLRRCLDALVWFSQQQTDGPTDDDRVEQMFQCSHLMDRLLSLVASHQKDFRWVAPYIIADYLRSLQRVTLIPKVKKSLLQGVHNILAVCNRNALAHLQVALPAGLKGIFETLQLEYTKYYKYSGFI